MAVHHVEGKSLWVEAFVTHAIEIMNEKIIKQITKFQGEKYILHQNIKRRKPDGGRPDRIQLTKAIKSFPC